MKIVGYANPDGSGKGNWTEEIVGTIPCQECGAEPHEKHTAYCTLFDSVVDEMDGPLWDRYLAGDR